MLGALADRVGTRPVFLVGMVMDVAFMCALAVPDGPWWAWDGFLMGLFDSTWALSNAIVVAAVAAGVPAGDASDFAITRLYYCLARPTVSVALETEDKEIEGSVASETAEPKDVRDASSERLGPSGMKLRPSPCPPRGAHRAQPRADVPVGDRRRGHGRGLPDRAAAHGPSRRRVGAARGPRARARARSRENARARARADGPADGS